MTQKSLVKSAAILAVAGLFVKLLGACFRIPLANWIGSEGMANYSPAYQIYAFLLVIATAGIPVAISRMVAERTATGEYREAARVFGISRNLMFCIGMIGFIILFFFADIIAGAIHIPGAALSMRATAPALLMVPIMSAYRGYFQGMQEVRPTAVSQIFEQVFRVVFGLSLALLMMRTAFIGADFTKYERGAAGGCFGASAGAVGGLAVMMVIYVLYKKKINRRIRQDQHTERETVGEIIKKVVVIAIPVSIGSAIMPIVNLTDASIVVTRLISAGFDTEVAKSMYGELAGFAQPLISFPQVFMQAIVVSIVPMVAAANRLRDRDGLKKNSVLGIRLAAIIAIPCAVGLIVLAEPVLTMLYPSQREAAIAAAACLQVLAIGFVFSGLVSAMTGILQGIGKQNLPVINLAIGVVVKIAVTWILTGIALFNIVGAAIGTMCAFTVAAVLDYLCVRKFTGIRVPVGVTIVKPVISALVMGVIVSICHRLLAGYMGSSLAALVAIFVGVCVYGLMVLRLHVITRDEMMDIKFGPKLARICDKLKLW